jgi:hypothetical protein
LPAPIRCIGSGHIRHEPLRCAPAALVAGRFCFIGVMHVPGWFGGFTYAASPASTPRRPDRECRRSARVLDRCRAEWRAAHPADAAGTGHGVGGGDDCLHQPLRLGFQRPDYRGDLASFGRVAASRPISGFQCARLSKQADKRGRSRIGSARELCSGQMPLMGFHWAAWLCPANAPAGPSPRGAASPHCRTPEGVALPRDARL